MITFGHAAHVSKFSKCRPLQVLPSYFMLEVKETPEKAYETKMVRQKERVEYISAQMYLFFIFFAVTAVTAIANIVKSSLGPVGLDKMLVDDIGVRFLFNVHLLCKIYQLLDILAFKK